MDKEDVFHSASNAVRHYTRFVRLSKHGLVGIIALLLLTMIVLPVMNRDKAGMRIAFSAQSGAQEEEAIMRNPRFQGVDEHQQPYLVTAEYALQKGPEEIVLHKVQGDMTMEDASWMLVSADQGLLLMAQKMLSLQGSVKLFHDGGYEFVTEKLNVDMAAGAAQTETPATGKGAPGHITAERFSVYDRGERLLFDGGVRMIVHPKRIKKGSEG